MKHLFLFFLFSCSLDSFSQDGGSGKIDYYMRDRDTFYVSQRDGKEYIDYRPAADTLRAMMLVTMHHGIAHARMGFVIVQPGRKIIYLDCRKRPLKYPAMGWGWEVVDKTEIKQL